eukprot:103697-Amphidinium_carterae.1
MPLALTCHCELDANTNLLGPCRLGAWHFFPLQHWRYSFSKVLMSGAVVKTIAQAQGRIATDGLEYERLQGCIRGAHAHTIGIL